MARIKQPRTIKNLQRHKTGNSSAQCDQQLFTYRRYRSWRQRKKKTPPLQSSCPNQSVSQCYHQRALHLHSPSAAAHHHNSLKSCKNLHLSWGNLFFLTNYSIISFRVKALSLTQLNKSHIYEVPLSCFVKDEFKIRASHSRGTPSFISVTLYQMLFSQCLMFGSEELKIH